MGVEMKNLAIVLPVRVGSTRVKEKPFQSFGKGDLISWKLNQLRQDLNVFFEIKLNLTPREQEILKLIAIGKTSQEIANILFISIFTVNTHRQNLLKKYKLKNITPLIKLI